MKYTIIIPTCSKDLTEICLSYISKLNKPKDDYEVLVIHNATEDDVKSVTEKYTTKIPNLRYFYDKTGGLMSARHLGAKEAKSEVLCYLDDDSFVDKNYLIGIEETFADPNIIMACGPNIPLYEAQQPAWLKYFWQESPYGEWMGELSLMKLYNRKMKVPTWFAFGCNMVIKKSTFFDVGGTNPDCMPKKLQRFQGDGETAISCKLNQQGHYALYNPKIKIHHLVPKERMTVDYFKKRGFYQGVCDSFSQIRKDNGFEYFDFTPNENIKKLKPPFFVRKYNKILKPLILKLQKNTKGYKEHLKIKGECEKSYKEGYEFHQNEVKGDPELLKWVLKENYLD